MNDSSDRRRDAMQRLAFRRRRVVELRRRAVGFSIALFVMAWAVVFGQMVTGNDPVLGSGDKALAARPAASATQAPPDPEPQPTQVVVDPITGQVVEVPASAANAVPSPAPVPEPAPVVTSQS